MASQQRKPGSGRLGGRKSTTGCFTCKIRKVKCDERYPSCDRCVKTGRKCDGYNYNHADGQASVVTKNGRPPQPLTTYGHHASEEVALFEFFVHAIIPGLTRLVDRDFWHRLVPQMSQTDLIIWHAVSAIASLIRYPQFSSGYILGTNTGSVAKTQQHRQALRLYGQSITNLRKHMLHTTQPSSTTMLTWVLYICIECLQDNIAGAAALYQRAEAIMRPFIFEQDGASPITAQRVGVGRSVMAMLRHMSMSLGLPPTWTQQTEPEASDSVEPLEASCYMLTQLIGQAHQFIIGVEEMKSRHGKLYVPSADLCEQQDLLRIRFLHLRAALDMSNIQSLASLPEFDEERYHTVLLILNHYYIWLATCLSTFESSYDDFFPDFSTMIEHARHVIHCREDKPPTVFTFETRVIPSLYFVVTRCRHPVIRREALSLLENGPEVENVHKSKPLVKSATIRIGIEESGDPHGAFCVQPQSFDVPPECDRVYRQRVIDHTDSINGTLQYLVSGRWRLDEEANWVDEESLFLL